MPNTARTGLITYDAKDPDTKFPPIEQLRPPKGAPNVLVILIDDVGFGASSAFGGPVPDAERREAGGGRAEVQPLPHHRAVLADAAGAADRAQPPLGRHGRHHRDRHRLRPATARCCPTPWRRSPRRSSSTATPPRSSASATRCRSGRPARPGRSTPGRPAAAASSTSTASSAARPTSGTRRSTRAPRRSSRRRRPKRATTSSRT